METKSFAGLKSTSSGQRTGFKEGQEARKAGRPNKNPYVNAQGQVILPEFHKGWANGWRMQDVIMKCNKTV